MGLAAGTFTWALPGAVGRHLMLREEEEELAASETLALDTGHSGHYHSRLWSRLDSGYSGVWSLDSGLWSLDSAVSSYCWFSSMNPPGGPVLVVCTGVWRLS